MRQRLPKFLISLPHIALGAALGFAACDRGDKSRTARPVPSPTVTTYEARGILKEASADRRKAIITHEEIPGYMEAMTMEFEIRDPALPNEIEPGDRVAFRLSVTETQSWIDQVRQLGGAADPRPVMTASATPNVAWTQVGIPLPDCAFIDQRGQAFRLSDLKGKALAITFIFTRCPLPNFCPLMNQHFAAAQHELNNKAGSSKWHLLSISLDPEYDTPERLATYAASYEPDSQHWTFATGNAEDIRTFGAAFGLAVIRNGAQIDHSLRTVIVDAEGRVQRIFTGNDWKAAELIDEMRQAMTVKP